MQTSKQTAFLTCPARFRPEGKLSGSVPLQSSPSFFQELGRGGVFFPDFHFGHSWHRKKMRLLSSFKLNTRGLLQTIGMMGEILQQELDLASATAAWKRKNLLIPNTPSRSQHTEKRQSNAGQGWKSCRRAAIQRQRRGRGLTLHQQMQEHLQTPSTEPKLCLCHRTQINLHTCSAASPPAWRPLGTKLAMRRSDSGAPHLRHSPMRLFSGGGGTMNPFWACFSDSFS